MQYFIFIQVTSGQWPQNYPQDMISPFLWYYLTVSWRTDAGQADTLCKGKNIAHVLQNTQQLEAASEVDEIMGSMEGEGWFITAAGMRQEFTRNQISLFSSQNTWLLFWISCMDKYGFASWNCGSKVEPYRWYLTFKFNLSTSIY